ncbi:hypothetical protein [Streptomyces violascens]
MNEDPERGEALRLLRIRRRLEEVLSERRDPAGRDARDGGPQGIRG